MNFSKTNLVLVLAMLLATILTVGCQNHTMNPLPEAGNVTNLAYAQTLEYVATAVIVGNNANQGTLVVTITPGDYKAEVARPGNSTRIIWVDDIFEVRITFQGQRPTATLLSVNRPDDEEKECDLGNITNVETFSFHNNNVIITIESPSEIIVNGTYDIVITGVFGGSGQNLFNQLLFTINGARQTIIPALTNHNRSFTHVYQFTPETTDDIVNVEIRLGNHINNTNANWHWRINGGLPVTTDSFMFEMDVLCCKIEEECAICAEDTNALPHFVVFDSMWSGIWEGNIIGPLGSLQVQLGDTIDWETVYALYAAWMPNMGVFDDRANFTNSITADNVIGWKVSSRGTNMFYWNNLDTDLSGAKPYFVLTQEMFQEVASPCKTYIHSYQLILFPIPTAIGIGYECPEDCECYDCNPPPAYPFFFEVFTIFHDGSKLGLWGGNWFVELGNYVDWDAVYAAYAAMNTAWSPFAATVTDQTVLGWYSPNTALLDGHIYTGARPDIRFVYEYFQLVTGGHGTMYQMQLFPIMCLYIHTSTPVCYCDSCEPEVSHICNVINSGKWLEIYIDRRDGTNYTGFNSLHWDYAWFCNWDAFSVAAYNFKSFMKTVEGCMCENANHPDWNQAFILSSNLQTAGEALTTVCDIWGVSKHMVRYKDFANQRNLHGYNPHLWGPDDFRPDRWHAASMAYAAYTMFVTQRGFCICDINNDIGGYGHKKVNAFATAMYALHHISCPYPCCY
jgi:hypothetical protein